MHPPVQPMYFRLDRRLVGAHLSRLERCQAPCGSHRRNHAALVRVLVEPIVDSSSYTISSSTRRIWRKLTLTPPFQHCGAPLTYDDPVSCPHSRLITPSEADFCPLYLLRRRSSPIRVAIGFGRCRAFPLHPVVGADCAGFTTGHAIWRYHPAL